jgi:hypothetical protein
MEASGRFVRFASRHLLEPPMVPYFRALAGFAASVAFAASPALAQTPPGTVTSSASITGVTQFDTDLDSGGQFHWGGGILSGRVSRQFTPQWSAGFSARYDYEEWKFYPELSAFPAGAPWGTINRPNIGLNVTYAASPDLIFAVAPAIEWGFESGANTGNAISAGAVMTALKVFGKGQVLGVGVGVFRQIDDTKVFPFLIVNWQLTDKLRLTNPLPAGPSGGAGLELAYALDDNWDVAGGGAYRSYRFRLKSDGPYPDGIGESTSIPLFARIGRKFGEGSRFDFYAGVATGGKLTVMDSNGNDIANDGYKTAPAIGLTLSSRF